MARSHLLPCQSARRTKKGRTPVRRPHIGGPDYAMVMKRRQWPPEAGAFC
jgi:hypothetical protein